MGFQPTRFSPAQSRGGAAAPAHLEVPVAAHDQPAEARETGLAKARGGRALPAKTAALGGDARDARGGGERGTCLFKTG